MSRRTPRSDSGAATRKEKTRSDRSTTESKIAVVECPTERDYALFSAPTREPATRLIAEWRRDQKRRRRSDRVDMVLEIGALDVACRATKGIDLVRVLARSVSTRTLTMVCAARARIRALSVANDGSPAAASAASVDVAPDFGADGVARKTRPTKRA